MSVISEDGEISILFLQFPEHTKLPSNLAVQQSQKLDTTVLPVVQRSENSTVQHKMIRAYVILLSLDLPDCVRWPPVSPCPRISVEVEVG